MPVDVVAPRGALVSHPAGSRTGQAAHPLEPAQLVWQRALQLAGPRALHDGVNMALELLRAAHHDPTTMTHALRLGHNTLRRDPRDERARAAAEILRTAIAFLGVKPRAEGLVGSGRSPC